MILGFHPQFVKPILSGEKIHTLRVDEKRRWKVGMSIQMATGVRTKNYRCFRHDKCKGIQSVKIVLRRIPDIWVDGRVLSRLEVFMFARKDGFETLDDFVNWFARGKYRRKKSDCVLVLRLIHWTDFRY